MKKLLLFVLISIFLVIFITSCTPGVEKPPIPQLLSPKNNAKGVEPEVVFSWNEENDSNQKIKYDIFISQIIGAAKTDVIKETGLTEKKFVSNSLGFNKNYSWKVVAVLENGSTSESEEFFFVTRDTPFEENKSVPQYSIPDQKIGENREISVNLSDFSKTYPNKFYDGNYTYKILNGPGGIENGKYIYKGDYDSAGIYDISIGISSLDESTVTGFRLTVENVNRIPEIRNQEVSASENATIQIDLRKSFVDPDGDTLQFYILEGSGIIKDGIYQKYSDYDSAGIYEVKIRVSDGEASQTALIKMNISDVNRKPVITVEDITTEENSDIKIDLKEKTLDPDGDPVVYELIEGPGKIENGEYILNLGYEDAGKHVVKISANDGSSEEIVEFTVTVSDVNRIADTYGKTEFSVKENESVEIDLNEIYKDPDGDSLEFTLVEGPGKIENGEYIFDTNYDLSGKYTIRFEISDGIQRIVEEYSINVENVNRIPVLEDEANAAESKTNYSKDDTLSWKITDPDGGMLKYDLYLGENNPPTVYAENMDTEKITLSELMPGKSYYWYVVAKDENGGKIETPLKKIEVEDRKPVLQNYFEPSDDTVGVSDSVYLSWIASDPDETQLTYDLYFGEEKNPPVYSMDMKNDKIKIEKLEENKTYYWKVVARDFTGSTAESAIHTFKTNVPLSGEIKPMEVRSESDHTVLSWMEVKDPENKKVLYDVYVGQEGKLTLYASNVSDTSIKIVGLSGDGEYQWKIVARETEGTVVTSPVWTFKTSFGPGAVNWIFKSNYDIRSSPAISPDGSILIGSDDNYLYSISKQGDLLWKFYVGNSIYSSPAVGVDSTVYIAAGYTSLYVLNPNGSKKWQYDFNSSIYSSPAVDAAGNVYIGASDTHLYSFNSEGKLNWKFKTEDEIRSSPAVDTGGNIYFGSDDGYFYALNREGEMLWKFKTDSYVRSSPAIDNSNNIYFGSFDGYLYVLNINGALLWKYKAEDEIRSSPAIYKDGTVYFGSFDNHLYAMDSDGRLKWKFKVNGPIWSSSPAIGNDGTVYIGTWEKELIAVSKEGTLKWKLDMDNYIRSSPVIDDDGALYIGTYGASLYSIQSGSQSLSKDSPWPMFRKDERHSGVK